MSEEFAGDDFSDDSFADEPAADVTEDGYDGSAELVIAPAAGSAGAPTLVPVAVTLRGQFDPISGHYHWYGRVASNPQVVALVTAGVRAVALRTPHGQIDTALSDVDPWGRPRVEGFGLAPFPVASQIATDPR